MSKDTDRSSQPRHQVICPEHRRNVAHEAAMSPAILSRGHVFVTGMTGSGPDGTFDPKPEGQIRDAFAKIEEVLEAAGLTLADVVEMTSYHVDIRTHFDAFDRVRQALLRPPWPAWTAVGVAELRRPGALVEIRVIAAVRPE